MLSTQVINSTYKFFQEPLANVTQVQVYSFFISKKGILWCIITLRKNGLSKFKNIFLLKELFFTSPQLKITLFQTVLLQSDLMCFVDTLLNKYKNQNIKREAND